MPNEMPLDYVFGHSHRLVEALDWAGDHELHSYLNWAAGVIRTQSAKEGPMPDHHACPVCQSQVPTGSLCHACLGERARQVTVCRLTRIRPHPVAPKLRIATALGHQIVVGDHYDDGVLGAYIPPDAYLPDNVAEDMWVKGRLAGARKNRVVAKEIAGVWSDGLFYGSQYFTRADDGTRIYLPGPAWKSHWSENQNVTSGLGITFDEAPRKPRKKSDPFS